MNLNQLRPLTSAEIQVGLRVIFIQTFFNVTGHLGTIREIKTNGNFCITWDAPHFNLTNRGKSPWTHAEFFAIPTPEILEQAKREQYANLYL